MKQLKPIVLSILFIVICSTLEAQNKWSIEFRPYINFPAEDFGESKIKTGCGFEITGAYRFTEHLSA